MTETNTMQQGSVYMDDLKSEINQAARETKNFDKEVIEVERDERDTEGSTFVSTKVLGLNGGLRLFELNKDTLVIKEARIVAKKNRKTGVIGKYCECRLGCRYVAAKNYVDADKKFVKMVTGKTYSQAMRSAGNELPM